MNPGKSPHHVTPWQKICSLSVVYCLCCLKIEIANNLFYVYMHLLCIRFGWTGEIFSSSRATVTGYEGGDISQPAAAL